MLRPLVGLSAAALLVLVVAGASSAAASQTLLLDFSSPSCGPCRQMRPVIAELARSGQAVREVDVTREPQLAARFRVDSVPTFIVLVDGREQARLTGATSGEQIVAMIDKAKQIAALAAEPQLRGQSPEGIAPVDFQGAPQTFASPPAPPVGGPQAGRIVELESPSARDPQWGTQPAAPAAAWGNAPAAAPSTASAMPQNPGAGKLTAATVRLSVEDAKGRSTGTGTIIDARSGEALILTCGHIFRESQGRGKIEVTLFDAGPAGAVKREVVAGRMIDFDLERDLGLVSIWINAPVQPVPVAPAPAVPREGDAVTSMGCNGGADPTPIVSRVNSVDRYSGPPNLQAAGAPVEGRSGGGLFNAAGQVVGVCFASDPQADEGLYAGLPSIHAKLDALGLSTIYQQPSAGTLAADNAPQPPQVRGQDPAGIAAPSATAAAPANPFGVDPRGPASAAALAASELAPVASSEPPTVPTTGPTSPMSTTEQATLEELSRRAGDSEVICIIRPQQPGGKSEVITVHGASSAFVEALERSAAAARTSDPLRR